MFSSPPMSAGRTIDQKVQKKQQVNTSIERNEASFFKSGAFAGTKMKKSPGISLFAHRDSELSKNQSN